MEELDLLGGLSDIVDQLGAGNANHAKVCDALLKIAQALAAQKAPQVIINEATEPPEPAPQVNVTVQPAGVTVMQAPAAGFDWEHSHIYDEIGRLVKTISKRVTRKEN